MSVKSSGLTSADASRTSAYPRRWAAAIVLMIASFMDLIDSTIVNVALPTIQHDLGVGQTTLEWVVAVYLLGFAATLILAGRLGDLLGRRRVFLVAVALFGLTSLLCAMSQTGAELVAARAVQGIAAAGIATQVLATIQSIFEGPERGTVFGLFGMAGGLSQAAGVVLGGVLTSINLFGLSWRLVFVVNVPIAIVLLILGIAVVPETAEKSNGRIDLFGNILLIAALVGIAYPLLEGRQLGWPAWCWVLLAAGVLVLVALGFFENRRRRDPAAPTVLSVALLRIPSFTAGLLVQTLAFGGLSGYLLVFTLWVQNGQGYSALRAGLTLLAFSVGTLLTGKIAGPLGMRFGRYTVMAGALSMALGLVGVVIAAQQAEHAISPWYLVPGLVLVGAGLNLILVPLVNVTLSAVPPEQAGGASGLWSTFQQFGGAIGVAVAGSVFFSQVAASGYTSAVTVGQIVMAGFFVVCALLCLALPRNASV